MSALTDWLKDIADAIRAKEESGDPIPHAAFPSRIASLPAGGDWKPKDWPDIEAIVDADVQPGYTYKYIYLMADDYSYAYLSGGSAYKTSDGVFYTSDTQHVWDTSKDFACSEGYKTRWVIVYTSSENQNAVLPYEVLWVDSGSCKFGNLGFSYKRKLRGVTGEFQQLTSASSMFNYCNSLTKVPDVLDLSQCTSASGMFNYCYSLTKVPDVLDFSKCTSASSMFYSCYSLTKVPDVLDLSQCTSVSSMFYNCYSLMKTPQLIVSPTSAAGITFSFSQSTRINADYRDSVAAFTGGTLTGGMVFHLPSVTNARTLTLNSMIKNLFTSTEQTNIAAHLTGKNWSLTW